MTATRKVREWIGKTAVSTLPPRVKLRIWTRENGTCHLSGRKVQPGEPYQFEHKIAIINGGENRESNIYLALADKHKEKTKADLAEKSHVADRAKSHIGANSAPQRPLKGRDFEDPPPKDRTVTKIASGPCGFSRRIVDKLERAKL